MNMTDDQRSMPQEELDAAVAELRSIRDEFTAEMDRLEDRQRAVLKKMTGLIADHLEQAKKQ
jgi:hypothetical protein